MTVVAIIQARMGSTRLPGKVLAELGPKPVLQWVVEASRSIPGNGAVVVATSTAQADDAIASWCGERGIPVFRGHEDDVLDRFAGAAREVGADVILRVTADCPLLDPDEAGKVLAAVVDGRADYACNNEPPSYPDGLDCEAFTRQALEAASERARRPSEREHVTLFIRDPANRFRIERLRCPLGELGDERWTLDNPEDLAFLRAVVRSLPSDRPPRLAEVLAVLDRSPELRQLNRGIARN